MDAHFLGFSVIKGTFLLEEEPKKKETRALSTLLFIFCNCITIFLVLAVHVRQRWSVKDEPGSLPASSSAGKVFPSQVYLLDVDVVLFSIFKPMEEELIDSITYSINIVS